MHPLKITDEAVFTLQMWKWRELSRCCGAQEGGGGTRLGSVHTLNFKCNLWWGWGGGGMISALVGKKVLLASERWDRQKMMVRSKAVGGPGFKFSLLDLIKMMLETTMRVRNNHQMLVWMALSTCTACVCVCAGGLPHQLHSWVFLALTGWNYKGEPPAPPPATQMRICLCDGDAGVQQRWPTCRLDFQRRLWQLLLSRRPLRFCGESRLLLSSPVTPLKTGDWRRHGRVSASTPLC